MRAHLGAHWTIFCIYNNSALNRLSADGTVTTRKLGGFKSKQSKASMRALLSEQWSANHPSRTGAFFLESVMSEGTKEETKSDRQLLSWEDRLAVVDYLRGLRSPLAFESKAAAAVHIFEQTAVDLSWSQLKYLMEQFPKLKLEEKFLFADDQAITNLSLLETRIIALESFLAVATNNIGSLTARVAQLELKPLLPGVDA